MEKDENKIYCRKCSTEVDGEKCPNCSCYVNSRDLITTAVCPKCGTEMKENICRNCGYDIDHQTEQPTNSDTIPKEQPIDSDAEPSDQSIDSDDNFEKVKDFVKKHPKSSIVTSLILVFLIGIGAGKIGTVPKETHTTLENQYSTRITRYDELKKEYDDYKAKMQPYESVQLTDAQNKAEQEKRALEEKKAAEEQAAAEEKAKKEAEERAAAEAKAAEEAKGYETGITFDNLARTPDDYKGKKVKFSGKVIQVIEGTTETQIRLAVNGDYDSVIFCRVPKAQTSSTRILEDDYIHIMGVSNGLISYQSTLGGTITIPDISVNDWGQN